MLHFSVVSLCTSGLGCLSFGAGKSWCEPAGDSLLHLVQGLQTCLKNSGEVTAALPLVVDFHYKGAHRIYKYFSDVTQPFTHRQDLALCLLAQDVEGSHGRRIFQGECINLMFWDIILRVKLHE